MAFNQVNTVHRAKYLDRGLCTKEHMIPIVFAQKSSFSKDSKPFGSNGVVDLETQLSSPSNIFACVLVLIPSVA